MKEFHIYTDGSHLDKLKGGRLGCGGVITTETGKYVDDFSMELTTDFMLKNFGSDECSNPSAELVAVYFALVRFEKYLKKADKVVIYSDYMGVKEWMTGGWKVNEKYIENIKTWNECEIKRQKLEGKVEFRWVKGHQKFNLKGSDSYWNNKADVLAKGGKLSGK